MNKPLLDAELGYTTMNWAAESHLTGQEWDPGFDAGRCLVFAKLGPYRRLFEKPHKFTKRFFHTLIPLTIGHWDLNDQLELYDGFCTVDIGLTIRYQATLNYIQTHNLDPETINAEIKAIFEPLVLDLIREELLKLTDGAWVQYGLNPQETKISNAINELLMLHGIQAVSTCQLKPFFKSFPDIKFKEESVYLMACKKNFEIIHQKQQEQFLQEQAFEQQRFGHKQKQLELQQQEKDLELLAQSQQAEYEKQVLLAQQARLAETHSIEQRLHAEKVQHETTLHELSLIQELRRQEQREALERELELRVLDQKLAHQLVIKEHELAAKIKAFELEKQQWQAAKLKLQAEEVKFKQHQKQMEIAAEFENKAYLHQQQLKLQNLLKSGQNVGQPGTGS